MSSEALHMHAFARDMTGKCRCGMTAEEYERLLADEAARPHAFETSKPIDAYGRSAASGPPTYPGRVIITWPARQDPQWWQPAVRDADTDQLVPVTAMFWGVDFEATDGLNDLITVDLRMLVDDEDRPLIGDRISPVRDPDDPDRARARVFRCQVAEIRTAT